MGSDHAKMCLRFLLSVFLSLITAQIHAQILAAPLSGSSIGATERKRVIENYGKLPLSFEANQGQTDEQVRFLSRGHGYTLFLTRDTAILALEGNPNPGSKRFAGDSSASSTQAHTKNAVLELKLLKPDPATQVSGENELGGKVSYFIGHDPKKWHTNLPTFARVKYKNIYPGIDLVYYGNQQRLEYDFIVAPGSNPKKIQFDVRGAKHLRRDKNGDLVVGMEGGEVRWLKPVVYQEKDGARQEIAARYVVKGHRLGFEVGGYDPRQPLIIDPSLAYSTFLNSANSGESGSGIAVDATGNAYITGSTLSGLPTTSGAFQTSCSGRCITAFVTKLNPSGSALVYSTYLGGTNEDFGYGITVDTAGDAYVTGQTVSTDFPVTPGAFQTTCGGTCVGTGFVTELNPSGSALVYSTYLGGSGGDQGNAIAIDGTGDAFITGQTLSSDFPVTTGAFQTTYPGAACGRTPLCGTNSFVTKFNPAGSALVYSTYLGGTGPDIGHGIALDTAGDAYVTGSTQSTNFPVTAGAFQTVCKGCSIVGGAPVLTNAFVTELNPAGSAPVYSTYLGGSGSNSGGDTAYGITVDGSGNAYVAGKTDSPDFPTTSGAFQTTCGSSCNPGSDPGHGFITKLNSTGSALVYSTFLHGSSQEGIQGIAIDAAGNAYVTGFTNSFDFPTTPNAFQTACVPDPDGGCNGGAFMTKMNSAGSALIYSSVLMGLGEDVPFLPVGSAIAVDVGGNAYITGQNGETDFPVTPGAFQTTYTACFTCSNAFVTKFAFVLPSPQSLSFVTQAIGTTSASQSTTLTNGSAIPVTGISVAITGTNSGDFNQTNNCGSSLAVGASCNINVTFTPTAVGSRSGSVSVSDSAANSPQTAALSGTGASTMTATPSSLSFPSQPVGTPSSAQVVTLNNTGLATLNITQVSISGDFAETNTCGLSLPAGHSCQISVTFTPTTTGTRTGTLSVTDNAVGSPQTVPLSGTGIPNFTVGPASPSSLTISPGQSATFILPLAPVAGFTGTVNLSCSVTPKESAGPTCTVPSSASVTGGTAASVQVTIGTTAATGGLTSHATALPPGTPPLLWTLALLGSGLFFTRKQRARLVPALGCAILGLVFLWGCGGGNTPSTSTSSGTPAGTYTATVTATSGNLSHNTTLTVVVQ